MSAPEHPLRAERGPAARVPRALSFAWVGRRCFGALLALAIAIVATPRASGAQNNGNGPQFDVIKAHTGNFVVGQNGVYTIAITNSGNASAGTITLTDTLPTGMTYVSGTGTSWTCSRTATAPDIVSCIRTVVFASGGTSSVTITVAVAAAAAPARTNTVYVAGGGSSSISTASNPTTVGPAPVTVTPKSGTASQLRSNGISYTGSFTVTNGGKAADNYRLDATKVPGTSLTIISVNGTAGATATLLGVGAGVSVVVPVVYTVASAASAGAVDTLKLLATSTLVATRKDVGAITVTEVQAGLSMTKQLFKADQTTLLSSSSQVSPGDILQFRVTVLATGTAGSTKVHVTDPLPTGVTFISTTPDLAGWTITQSSGMVTADLTAPLPVSQSRFFWIKVRVR